MNFSPVIDAASLPRIDADTAIATGAGLRFTEPTLYEHGTVLFDSGRSAAQRSRLKFEGRPLFEDAAAGALAAYRTQERVDTVVDLRMVRMDPANGHAFRTEQPLAPDYSRFSDLGEAYSPDRAERVGLSDLALGQAVARMGGPQSSTSYLSDCPPTLRAHNFNYWNDNAQSMGKEKPAKVRTMLVKDRERTAYAVLSPQYQVRDLPECLPVFTKALESIGATGARGDYKMAGSRWSMRATFHSPISPEELRVGDIFRGAVWMSGIDDGTGCVKVGVGVERARCCNLTTIWAKEVSGLRHNSRDFDRRLVELMRTAVKAIEGFATKWADATRDSIFDGVWADPDPKKVFQLLVQRGLVKLTGEGKEELVEKLVRAWQVEPGFTRADVVNAVTRAAHTESWKSPWAQEELEAQGGQLLYNYVTIAQE